MYKKPLVSIITPTKNRDRYLETVHHVIDNQSHKDFEWLILDDSPQPSQYMMSFKQNYINYFHTTRDTSIGLKRNLLINEAKGDIIIHFDDDDYYSPNYIKTMVSKIENGYDLVKLSGWHIYDVLNQKLAYWNLTDIDSLSYCLPDKPNGPKVQINKDIFKNNYLGYGFSYVYKKSLGKEMLFPDINFGEDSQFIKKAILSKKIGHFQDKKGLCLHILHTSNTSRCFPQELKKYEQLKLIYPDIPENLITI